MRFVSSISCALITIGLIYLDNPEPLNRFVSERANDMEHLVYDKEISFNGLSYVNKSEVEQLLPMDKSIPWWIFNKIDIETQLLRHSLIQSAELHTCTSLAVTDWGCFTVDVKERHPSYAALLDDEVWILGQDGGLLFPVARKDFEEMPLNKILSKNLAREVSNTKLKMLQIAGSSPDIIHARLSYTRRAVEIIEEHSNLEVAMARCSRQGEIRARFEGYPFEAVFDYAEDAPKTLAVEAERLGTLLKEFGNRAQTVELIDLAYNKLAIVRFHESEKALNKQGDKTMFTTKGAQVNLKRKDPPR